MPKVAFAVLMERAIEQYPANALFDVYYRAAKHGYTRISTTYGRTDISRNNLAKAFLEWSTDPQDCLVMLDCDHKHPANIVERLVAHDKPVVGALAFRRGEPYDPCFFLRDDEGILCRPGEWEPDLVEGVIVGTAAIAIRRHVFTTLVEKGCPFPWFRYEYRDGTEDFPTEDMYFGFQCEKAGISHWCDLSLVTPHMTVAVVDQHTWQVWKGDNEDKIIYGVMVDEIENSAG